MPLLATARKRFPERDDESYKRMRSKVLKLVARATAYELEYWRTVCESKPQASLEGVTKISGLCRDLAIDASAEIQQHQERYRRLSNMDMARTQLAFLTDPFARLNSLRSEWEAKEHVAAIKRYARAGKFSLSEIGVESEQLTNLIRIAERTGAIRHVTTPARRAGGLTEDEARYRVRCIAKYAITDAEIAQARKLRTEPHVTVWAWFQKVGYTTLYYEHFHQRYGGKWPSIYPKNVWPSWGNGQVLYDRTGANDVTAMLPEVLSFMRKHKVHLRELGLTRTDVSNLKNRLLRIATAD